MQTHVVRIPAQGSELGHFRDFDGANRLEEWCVSTADSSRPSIEALASAGAHLKNKDTPVAFPTETVYGLGADATRSAAVKGIYSAKGRPSDNPLIVHVCDLQMLRSLLGSTADGQETTPLARYKTLIEQFWPGPLTILLPNAQPSKLAPESTVVDGLCEPPVVLRPGGISMSDLRSCSGWGNAVKAYKDHSEEGKAAPRAPGMKYKHYSPKARVVLYEASYNAVSDGIVSADIEAVNATQNGHAQNGNENLTRKVGVIRTQRWKAAGGLQVQNWREASPVAMEVDKSGYEVYTGDLVGAGGHVIGELFDINLGKDTKGIAQGLFAALRELDSRGADTIFVDGIDGELDIAAAVMNRLRKAASELRS
ncbi:hypothetical protein LLEC1_01882 [Akanthomyces lecanii]|uniref:Threonylcarbamoyl-AMP synthase n=1 Tax=Cordyceps confragosa TaxID=2714763 RepID=A0A179IAY6_CORDF|nr:hypothetical protein LLEC1_01882 [Akanthomyces lecanii]